MNTKFATVYDCFLGKITDDLYIELTPEDTLRDLHNLLMRSLPGFEFPRVDLYDFTEKIDIIDQSELQEDDFLLGVIWHELEEEDQNQQVVIDNSCFNNELTREEIEILALLMMCGWVQRQVTSIENTRMKYSGTDFKMTSQANHLAKLLSLLSECQRQAHHYQRLYKRRRRETLNLIDEEGNIISSKEYYRSNWDVFGKGVYNK